MKLITSLAASAALLAASANAAPQGAWHVRVHTHTELKGESETCSASGGAVECRGDLTCVQVSDWYGACMMLKPTLMKQCGGHSLTGPWKYPCVPNAKGVNSTCVFLSPYFSQCQDLATRELYRYKGKSHKLAKALKAHDASQPIQLYGQCKWADAAVKCADGLQCITENDHYGQCRKREAALYEQCGGKSWKEPWSATCTGASVCVKRDEWYSQCLPNGTPATASPAPSAGPVTPIGGKPAAGKWDQCGGASFQGPTTCAAGAVCVKHNNWYSQCKPDKLPVGELCAMTKQDSTWSHPFCEGTAQCVVSNPDGSESRCK